MEGAFGRGRGSLVSARALGNGRAPPIGARRALALNSQPPGHLHSKSSLGRLNGRPFQSSRRCASLKSRSEVQQIVAARNSEGGSAGEGSQPELLTPPAWESERDIEAEGAKLLDEEFKRASDAALHGNGVLHSSSTQGSATSRAAPESKSPEDAQRSNETGDGQVGEEDETTRNSKSENGQTETLPASRVGLAGSTSSFRWAQSAMSGLAARLLDLEKGLQHREQGMMESTKYINTIKEQTGIQAQTTRLRQAEEMARRMQLQLKTMERTVEEKDEALNRLLQRTQVTEEKLEVVERQAASERAAIMHELQAEKARSKVEIESVMKREEGLRMRLKEAQEGLAERDAFLKQLQEEAALSASALKQAAQAMVAARDRTLRIEEQLEMLGDQLVREKDNTVREKQKSAQLSAELTEARMTIEELNKRVQELETESEQKERGLLESSARLEDTGKELGVTAEALQSAEERIRELERILEKSRDELQAEVQSSASALDTAAAKEKRLQESEARAQQLLLEVAALKEEVARKEKIMDSVREETTKNAELLTSAAKTRKDLAEARRRIEQLENEMRFLQEEVHEKESFLQDVRADARSSAEALRTATLIKQELNQAKERAGQLMDEIEAKDAEIQTLKAEVEENPKAQAAEMALQELRRRTTKLESERDALRSGIAKRDQALSLMKQELERGTHMLSAAAETREALREMKAQMDYLQHEAESKARRLSALEDEIVGVGQTSIPEDWLQQQQQQWAQWPEEQGRSLEGGSQGGARH